MKRVKHVETNKLLTGFSLVELLVVIAIITIITAAAVLNIPLFKTSTRTSMAAEDILTLMKEARQRSLSVKEFGTTGTFPNYGVVFKTGLPNTITVYADCVGDDNGDGVLNDEDNFTDTDTSCGMGNLVKTHTIPSPILILKLRFCPTSTCGVAQEVSQLFIEFVRPEPTTWISKGVGSGNVLSVGMAEIDIGDASGSFIKTIIVSTNGLLSLE